MKKISIIFILVVWLFGFGQSFPAELMDTEEYTPGKVYLCPVGKGIAVELPRKGRYKIVNGESEFWGVEKFIHFVWVAPRLAGKDLVLKIRNRAGSVAEIRFKSTDRGDRESYKLLVKEFPRKPESDPGEANGKIRTEVELAVNGGVLNSGKEKNRFYIDGESILAAKIGNIVVQGAGKVEVNSLVKQAGGSVGVGYEPGRIGVFLFADGLLYRYDDWNRTFHLQLRPAARVKFRHFTGSVFYAWSITPDRYVGGDVVENNLDMGIYNRAIDHLGMGLEVKLGRRFYIDLRSVVGKSLFRVEAASSYRLLKNLYVNVGYSYADSGKLNITGFERYSRFYAGISLGLGAQSRFTDLNRKIIFRPDYPIIASIKKEKSGGEEKDLRVTLTADPRSGYAPLQVDFRTTVTGGAAPYDVKWFINGEPDPGLTGERVQRVFTKTGTYRVHVAVTDAGGLKGDSNSVTIEVLEKSGEESFTIVSTADKGGSIDPLGTVSIKKGDGRKFFMKPENGYKVADVIVDKKSLGAKSSYEFQDVKSDHTIHVRFVSAAERLYTITSEAGPGGTISPAGTVSVPEGQDVNFTITPSIGYRVKEVKVDDTSRGVVEEYTFERVSADHSIRAEFMRNTYTVTADSGPGGGTDPAGTISINEGDDLKIKIVPDQGYRVSDVKVDGQSVGAVSEYNFSNICRDHTLHAEFTTIVLPTYTITATAGEGGSISPSGKVPVTQGSDANFTITPSTGYRIRYVKVDGVSKGSIDNYRFTDVSADHTIHAEFERITHTVTTTSSVGGHTDPAGETVVNQGDDLVVGIVPEEGYKIANVLVDGKSVGPVPEYNFANVHEDHTLEAVFEKKKYTITASAGSGGGIDPTGTVIVEHGDSQRFTITPATGYLVKAVTVDGVSKGAISTFPFDNVTANHSIRAEFEIQTFVIQASSGTGGKIRPVGDVVLEFGQSRTFTMEPVDPRIYEIDRLIVDGQNKGALMIYTFSNVTADHTIRALWKKHQYRIESSCTAGGTITPLGITYYDAQATPTYTITPAPGYVIEKVVIDGTTNAGAVKSYTFSPLLSNHTIRAYFKLKTYTVTISKRFSDGNTAIPPNPVTPIGTVTVNHGDDLEISIDNHFQGGGGSVIYSLDYITVNGASYTYRGDTKSIIVHTLMNIMEDKQVVCYFYQRTN